jgi:hypothetical protein
MRMRLIKPYFYKQKLKQDYFLFMQVVANSQPTYKPNQALNQKRLFLQKLIEDEVVGRISLLLLI